MLPAILVAGLIAGSFDLSFAFLYYDAKPARILQTVAGGLLGRATFEGGAATAALGFCLQYVIATGAAAVYLALSRLAPRLTRGAVASGIVFGAVIYFVMNMVVVPLSAWHSPPWPPHFKLMELLAHFGIGLIIAVVLRRMAGSGAPRAFPTRE